MKITAIAACFLFLAGLSAAAQTRVIEGVVVRSDTNAPVVGAQMAIRWDLSEAELSARVRTGLRAPARVVTDDHGRFTISIADSGRYRLSAKASGFGEQYFGSRTGFVFDHSASGLLFVLRPAGNIAGRVIGTDGIALAGIDVTLMVEGYDETGRKLLRETASVSTDDRGEYRLLDVPSGRYYVRAHSRSERVSRQVAVIRGINSVDASRKIPPTFFPSAATPAAASLVEVVANTEAKRIDIVCPLRQTYSIRGTVVDPITRAVPQQVVMSLFGRDALTQGAISPTAYKRNDGTFEFSGITPGRYWVTAMLSRTPVRGADPTPPRLVRAAVEITTADVENVELPLVPLVSLDGRLKFEGGAITDLKGYEDIRIFLNGPTAENGSGLGLPPTALFPAMPDGRFGFRDMVPDDYRVLVRGLPDTVYVKAVRYGDADVLSTSFRVANDSSGALEVVLSSGAGQLSGTLVGADSVPLPFAEVVLMPAGSSAETQHLYKRVTTNADGSFSIKGIAPGGYWVFGWSEDAAFEYFDPKVRSEIESAVPLVRVSDSSNATARVTVFRKN